MLLYIVICRSVERSLYISQSVKFFLQFYIFGFIGKFQTKSILRSCHASCVSITSAKPPVDIFIVLFNYFTNSICSLQYTKYHIIIVPAFTPQ